MLLIDCDPLRLAGVSSTDAEKAAALGKAREIRGWLAEALEIETVLADSGNGAHLLIRVDLPNTPDVTALVKGVLDALDARFSDDAVQVDRKVYNAARICKIYGSVSRKGDHTPDRPHRVSRLLEISDGWFDPVPEEKLRELAGMLPQAEAQQADTKNMSAAAVPVAAWLEQHGLVVQRMKGWGGGTLFALDCCPFNADHRGTFHVIQWPNGNVSARCFHNSCAANGWNELRDQREPGWRKIVAADVLAACQRIVATGDTNSIFDAAELIAELSVVDFAKLKATLPKSLSRRDLATAVKEARAKRNQHMPPQAEDRPVIMTSGRYMRDVTAEAVAALATANDDSIATGGRGAAIFQQDGSLFWARLNEANRLIWEPMSLPQLRGQLDRAADFVKRTRLGGIEPTQPPQDVVADLLTVGNWAGIPPVAGIIETAAVREDGTILVKAGYDAATRLLCVPAEGLTIPPIPENPTKLGVQAALNLLLEPFWDFPFEAQADRANALALLLTPLLKPVVGLAPLGIISAPDAANGKTLIASTIGLAATGQHQPLMSLPRGKEEWAKTLHSVLLAGTPFVIFDNVGLDQRLDAPELALVLTSSEFSCRILGSSKVVRVPQRATWCVTGNNVRIAGDMLRRCFQVRLDAQVSKPAERDTSRFRHPALLDWVAAHRGELLGAALTLIRAWWAAGKPAAPAIPNVGSFERWAFTVGSILHHTGVEGFLANGAKLEEFDEERPEWLRFLREIHESFGNRSFTMRELGERITTTPPLYDARPTDLVDALERSKGSTSHTYGLAFRTRVGARFGGEGLMIEHAGEEGGATLWRVRAAKTARADSLAA
jgi:hypothetical protein